MCLNPIRAATAVTSLAAAIVVLSAAPGVAAAWPFGAAKPAGQTTAGASPTQTPPAKGTAPTKASPAERALADRQDPLTRMAFWTREFKNDPTDAEAGGHLANALRALGRYPEAADSAQKVLAVHPKDAPALFELARAQISAGQGFYAIEPMKTAAAQDPRDWRPWSLLGVAYDQNKQPDLAAAAYEHALKLSPDNSQALTNYALFRATHGEPQAAEVMLRKAVAQPAAGAAARQNLALVLGLQGKFGEAESLLRQDLPPGAADADLAYLHAVANGTVPVPTAPAASAKARSWDAVKASEAAAQPAPSR